MKMINDLLHQRFEIATATKLLGEKGFEGAHALFDYHSKKGLKD